jgi:UDP-4-amino-4,6-dideoxy-N-acetyl-beta-L-altrosamine transaminase
MIPYGRQHINEQDIQAVVDVLRSDWLTQGPAVPRFENTVAEYCGATHAVAVCNATAALHLACMALDLRCSDILWTSPNTFVASANCALYCGAAVDFVDIDPRTYNMSVDALRKKLEGAEKNGRLPKILITVHFAGQSCEMRDVKVLAERYGFRIIEDASHAIGGKYLDGPVGNCRYSDVTIFSFHPVKVITTGEGGMALTNSATIAERIRLLRSHGVTRDSATMLGESEGDWYYEQIELGYNYRMTDIQAALGSSQMSRLEKFVQRRHEVAAQYDQELDNPDVTRPWQHPDTYSAFHLYPIRLSGRKYERRQVFDRLRAAGIGVNVHYIPVHLQPHYRQLGFKEGDFWEAEQYYREAISLPMFAALTEEQQVRVIAAIRDVLQ